MNCDAVLIWKLDRFGRSLRHLVNAIAELEAVGAAFISLRNNLDLSTPSGRLMFQIVTAMAEFERALIQERVKAGLQNARAKGKRLGRPSVLVDATRIATLHSGLLVASDRKRVEGWGRNCPPSSPSVGGSPRPWVTECGDPNHVGGRGTSLRLPTNATPRRRYASWR